jgi:hypothetical protein
VNDPVLTISIVVAVYLTVASAVVVWRHSREIPSPTEPEPEPETAADGHKHGHKSARARAELAATDRRRVGRFLRLLILYMAGLLLAGVVAALAQPLIGPLVPMVTSTDGRRAALAVALGWSLVVVNLVIAWHLVGALLPPDDAARPGGPGTMGGRIGMLERGLVVMLTLSGGPGSIGFVIAAKTLARFKELDDQEFAERYLLGTLASVTIALASALAVQQVWLNAA